MPRTQCFTRSGLRISPETNSISRSTSFKRRGAPRELSSSTRTVCPSLTSALTSAEPIKPLPPVTNMELTVRPQNILADVDPAAVLMRGTSGIQQHLNTKTFDKSRSSLPSTLDSIQEAARKAGNGRNASVFWETAIKGVVNFKQRWLRGTARKTQLKSAHIVPRWVDQGQGPVLTIK